MGQLNAAEVEVTVDYGTFGIVDEACAEDTYNLDAPEGGGWLRTDRGMAYPDLVSNVAFVRVRFESWDSEPPREGTWARVDEAILEMPSGIVGIEEVGGEWHEEVFELPQPGLYQIRVAFCVARHKEPIPARAEQAAIERAWQGHEEELRKVDEYFLIQYWPA